MSKQGLAWPPTKKPTLALDGVALSPVCTDTPESTILAIVQTRVEVSYTPHPSGFFFFAESKISTPLQMER
jgi:hypothetical protein